MLDDCRSTVSPLCRHSFGLGRIELPMALNRFTWECEISDKIYRPGCLTAIILRSPLRSPLPLRVEDVFRSSPLLKHPTFNFFYPSFRCIRIFHSSLHILQPTWHAVRFPRPYPIYLCSQSTSEGIRTGPPHENRKPYIDSCQVLYYETCSTHLACPLCLALCERDEVGVIPPLPCNAALFSARCARPLRDTRSIYVPCVMIQNKHLPKVVRPC
jgi:hypothetical protein